MIIHDWDGKPITEPGIYRGVGISAYHSATLCDGPSISSSGLRKIDLESPLHYWDTSPLNPNAVISDEFEEAHFRIGKAAHTMLLEPETFLSLFVTRPSHWDSWRTVASREWRGEQIRAGKVVLSDDELEQVTGVVASVRHHPLFKDGLFGGDIECSIVWKDSRTGVWLKARPDNLPHAAGTSVDFKCMASADPRKVAFAIRDYGYDMQAALVRDGMSAMGVTIEDSVVFACESSRPHATHLAVIGDEAIHYARLRNRRALNTFSKCLETGYWPGYDSEDGRVFSPSSYELDTYEKQQKAGFLPTEF